jgi:hypothetical protein
VLVKQGMARLTKDLTAPLLDLGFARTKTHLWVRARRNWADFMLLERVGASYGSPQSQVIDCRLSFGTRDFADTFPALALNGPSSRPGDVPNRSEFQFSFSARTGNSYERCRADLLRLVHEVGEPWFEHQAAARHEPVADPPGEALDLSRRLLGLK